MIATHTVAISAPTMIETMPTSSSAKKPTENGAVIATRSRMPSVPTIRPSMTSAPARRHQLART
jgi:hypothetical protein